jgi:hypothetical protein
MLSQGRHVYMSVDYISHDLLCQEREEVPRGFIMFAK